MCVGWCVRACVRACMRASARVCCACACGLRHRSVHRRHPFADFQEVALGVVRPVGFRACQPLAASHCRPSSRGGKLRIGRSIDTRKPVPVPAMAALPAASLPYYAACEARTAQLRFCATCGPVMTAASPSNAAGALLGPRRQSGSGKSGFWKFGGVMSSGFLCANFHIAAGQAGKVRSRAASHGAQAPDPQKLQGHWLLLDLDVAVLELADLDMPNEALWPSPPALSSRSVPGLTTTRKAQCRWQCGQERGWLARRKPPRRGSTAS